MSYIGNTVQNQNYVPAIDYFNGTGAQTAFTLSRPVASVAAVQAVISNVPQNPGSAFTVSGSTITFTSAPPSGTANIYVYYTSPNTQVVQPGQGTVGTTQLADAAVTTAKLASGAVGSAQLASGAALANIGSGGITQSYLATNVGATGPAFSVYTTDNSSYFNNSSATKVRFNAEVFDTNNNFDSTTNYRFTPTVAGYYFMTFKMLTGFSAGGQVICILFKNGSNFIETQQIVNAQQATGVSGSCVVYANGSTDYFEVYMYQDNGGTRSIYANGNQTFWQGCLLRAA